MASIQKYRGKFRAHVCVSGIRESKICDSVREAKLWAHQREEELKNHKANPIGERHTLRDAMRLYRKKVTPTKRGAAWEERRFDALLASTLPLDTPIANVTPDMLGKWRDERLEAVKPGTVLRDFSLLSAVFEIARAEWRWIPANPVRDIRKPPQPASRDMVITRQQIKSICRALGYSTSPVRSVSHAVAVAFLFALRTGMRAGEICGLTWDRVHDGYCRLPITKTVPRDVPLNAKAMRLLLQMRGWDDVLVFGIKTQTLDAMFRKARKKAGLAGFTFHDTRHTAATRIAQKVHILDLCRIFGWSSTQMALRYYNPKASDIAKRI